MLSRSWAVHQYLSLNLQSFSSLSLYSNDMTPISSQKWFKLEVQGTLLDSLTPSWPVHQFSQFTLLHTAQTTSQKWTKLQVQGTLFQSLTPSWPVHQFTQLTVLHTAKTTSQKWTKLQVQGTLFQSLTPYWPVHQFHNLQCYIQLRPQVRNGLSFKYRVLCSRV